MEDFVNWKLTGEVKELRVIGGGAKSPFWLQLKANVFNRKVVIPAITEAATLGAAMLAGVGNGTYTNAQEAVREIYREKTAYTPDPIESDQYESLPSVQKGLPYTTLLLRGDRET
jgi:xylulokinase